MALDPRELSMLMNQARIKTTGASDDGILVELYDVFKEFFADSQCWWEDITFQATVDRQEYILSPLQEGQIIALVGVWDEKGIPIDAFMPTFGTIRLVNVPNTTPTTRWFARVIKNITIPTTKDNTPIAPQWVLGVYSIHILDGLLGKLMAQPGKSWSNQQLGTYHLRRFRTGIQIAKAQAQAQNQVGAQNWTFPRGWSSRGQRGGSSGWPGRIF